MTNIQKIQIRPKGTGDYSNLIYPETSADMVIASDGKTVEDKLKNVVTIGQLGAAGGAAPLDNNSKLLPQYMPSDTNIEARTTDPGAPAIGRIWLRTDL
jgi:hypothetical protein